jgi:hypothetical protein
MNLVYILTKLDCVTLHNFRLRRGYWLPSKSNDPEKFTHNASWLITFIKIDANLKKTGFTNRKANQEYEKFTSKTKEISWNDKRFWKYKDLLIILILSEEFLKRLASVRSLFCVYTFVFG